MLGLTPAAGNPPKQCFVLASNLNVHQRGRMLAQIQVEIQTIAIRRRASATVGKSEKKLLKATDGDAFIGIHFEDCKQFRDLQKVVNLLCQVKQFQFATFALHGGIAAH